MSQNDSQAPLDLECPLCFTHFHTLYGIQLHIEYHQQITDKSTATSTTSKPIVTLSSQPTKLNFDEENDDVVIVLDTDENKNPQVSANNRASTTQSTMKVVDQLLKRREEENKRWNESKNPAPVAGTSRSSVNSSPVVITINDADDGIEILGTFNRKSSRINTDVDIAKQLAIDYDQEYAVEVAKSTKENDVTEIIDDTIPEIVIDNSVVLLTEDEDEILMEEPNFPQPVFQNGQKDHDHEDLLISYDLTSLATREEIFDTKYQDADLGPCATFDLHEKIRRYCQLDRKIEHLYLSCDCAHFASEGSEETKNWGCGYRNAQVLISAMLNVPEVRKRLVNRLRGLFVPSVEKIQKMTERARAEGWDPQGKLELGTKLVSSKTWIGPVDLYVLFMSMGIEAKIMDFTLPHKNHGQHPALFNWLEKHFSNAATIESPCLPVYLQHSGHSQVIIGLEKRQKANERKLILFDPSTAKEQVRCTTGNQDRWLDDNVRQSMEQTSKPSYQVLWITGRVLSHEEQDAAKLISQIKGIPREHFVSK